MSLLALLSCNKAEWCVLWKAKTFVAVAHRAQWQGHAAQHFVKVATEALF